MNRFVKSMSYAWNGLRTAFKEERNLKFHLSAALAAVAAGFYFDIDQGEWLAILLVIGSVVALEMINSSIERLVDLISPEQQPLAGKIKDIAAGAVLIAAITSVCVGFIIFHKYIIAITHNS